MSKILLQILYLFISWFLPKILIMITELFDATFYNPERFFKKLIASSVIQLVIVLYGLKIFNFISNWNKFTYLFLGLIILLLDIIYYSNN